MNFSITEYQIKRNPISPNRHVIPPADRTVAGVTPFKAATITTGSIRSRSRSCAGGSPGPLSPSPETSSKSHHGALRTSSLT